MADYLRRDMRDPLTVLLEREQKTCAGCIYRSSLWGMWICIKRDKVADKRCATYRETI